MYKADEQEVFQRLMNGELFEMCGAMIGMGSEDVNLSALQLVCGLV